MSAEAWPVILIFFFAFWGWSPSAAGGHLTKCSESLYCPCPKCVEKARNTEKKIYETSLEVSKRLGGKTQLSVVLSKRSGSDEHASNLFSDA